MQLLSLCQAEKGLGGPCGGQCTLMALCQIAISEDMPACCSQGSRAGELPPHTSRRTVDRSEASPSQAAEATARTLWAVADANTHAQPVGAVDVISEDALPHSPGQIYKALLCGAAKWKVL